MKFAEMVRRLFTKNMFIVFLMGFGSGIPLLLTLRTLQAWMTDVGVDLKTIGIFSLAGLPYTLKFLWAPLLDRYKVFGLGRRKGWLLVSQVALVGALFFMAAIDPKTQTAAMALLAVIVSFFSASQDIVVDAYRREILPDEDLGLGSTYYIYGYRIAMWVSGAFALGLAAYISWAQVYMVMALIMAMVILVTLFSDEPTSTIEAPKSLREAVIEPFKEFLTRPGAWLLLAFILLYKVGDNMAGNMLTPFYLKMGYTKVEIAAIAKTFAVFSTLLGGFLGGIIIIRIGILKSLYLFGFLQAASTLFFTTLYFSAHNNWLLASVISLEDLTSGMGTAAFVAFMGSITNKRFTATQFALLSSLMGVPRVFIAAPTGFLAESLGWPGFFVTCAVLAIPGLLMIRWVQKLETPH
ncbi:MAG: AmpG family muropeptide MFS transporter [Bdellovibrionia bacterium]